MKNRWEKRNDCVVIFANGNQMQHEILVDEADFETVNAHPGMWVAHKNGNTRYAQAKVRAKNGKWGILHMHRLLLDPPEDLWVDHRNHNGLDNRRENIRIVTHGENHRNRINNVEFQSNADGVSWESRHQAWMARPWVNGRREYLGRFDIKIKAEAARIMFLETGKRVKRLFPIAEFQSNVPGVRWDMCTQAWVARPKVAGRPEWLGRFDIMLEAEAAVDMFLKTGMRVKRSRKSHTKKDDPLCIPPASAASVH